MCPLLWCLSLLVCALGKDVVVKEGSSLLYYQNSPVTEAPAFLSSSTMSPIESMQYLRDTCFIAALDRYEFNYCPFRNITQRRIMGNTVSYIGSFYRYQEPILLDETVPLYRYSSVEYRGGKCVQDENVDLKSIVNYVCNEDEKKNDNLIFDYNNFGIVTVDESVQCKYTFTFNVPLPCAVLTTEYKLETLEEIPERANIAINNEEKKEEKVDEVLINTHVYSVNATVNDTVVNSTVTSGVDLKDKVDLLEQKLDQLLQLVTELTERQPRPRV